jgi:hypothetical protein
MTQVCGSRLEGENMSKRASLIEVALVEENADMPNEQIEKEIRKETSAPWSKNIVKVITEEQL